MARDAASVSCWKCGYPLRLLAPPTESASLRCGHCDTFAFTLARACGPYDGALREAVLRLKHQPHLPRRLRRLLLGVFTQLNETEPSEALIPVPLHPRRLTERGFNQADVLAHAVAEVSGLRVHTTAVTRIKQTERHRFGMGQRERSRSLERAFAVRAPRLVAGRALLVIDDVMTTASTADEMARTLLAAGARSVNVLTLTRAMYHLAH